MAKKGSKASNRENRLSTLPPQAAIKSDIHRNIYREWQTEWNNMRAANHTKSFYGGPNAGKAKYVYKLARLELGRFVRIVTGHNNLGFFQTKIGLANRESCRFCSMGHETITHLMSTCPKFVSFQRDILMNELPKGDMKWSVRDLLDFSYIPGINEAFEGTWVDGDPLPEWSDPMDVSYDTNWLENDNDDEVV